MMGWQLLVEMDGDFCGLPSGKHRKNYGKSPCFMGLVNIEKTMENHHV
jgi:hypothetical protein